MSKSSYKGNFDFSELINDAMKDHFEEIKRQSTGRGKTQANEDWINAHTDTFKTPLVMIPVQPDFKSENRHKWAGWTAPAGWNNYLKTGNFKGCYPIIKPGAKFNTRASFIDPIKFEMV